MKRTSLKLLLPAAFMATVVVFIAGYSAILLHDMRVALKTQVGDTARMLTQTTVDRVDNYLETLASQLDALQTTIAPLTAVPDQLNTSPAVLPQLQQAQKSYGFSETFLLDASGSLLVKAGSDQLSTGQAIPEGVPRDLIQNALSAPIGSVHIQQSTTFAADNKSLAFLATPVMAPLGQSRTILVAGVPAEGLSAAIQSQAAENASYRFTLVGQDGRSIAPQAAPNRAVQTPPTAWSVASHEAGISVNTDGIGTEGQATLTVTAPMTVLSSGWSIVTEIDHSTIFQPVRRLLIDTLWSLAGAILLVIGLGLILGRWIANPLADLTNATRALIAHEPVSIAHKGRRDEVGQLARGLEAFAQEQQQADVARTEMLFKGKAFNTTSTAMMISDADGKLIYINNAALNLFRANLSDFRNQFSDFNPDNLLGSNISIFHRNHSRNMAMLANSDRKPTEADITIGGQVFALGINPVEAEDGSRAGYVAVWENVRDKRRNSAILGAVNRTQVILEAGLDGNVISLNEVGQAYYGYSANEITGKPLGLLFKGGDEAAREAMNRAIALGSVTEEHHRVTRTGEDRYVVCNLNAIQDSQGKVQRIVGICSDHTQARQERNRAEAAEKARAAAQADVVDGLRHALDALAQGDLSARIKNPFPQEYEALRHNCNTAFDSLAETLTHVRDVASAILDGANEIASSAEDLSRRTESQAATLEETAAALDSLTSNVKSATEGTLHADRKVTSAHDEAESNGSVVRKAITAMDAIEMSSHKISQIITLIDDIAFQTNLLALNAGVEAARAGDAGRGFAVVAAEVRALAQRSSEAAKEIKTLIAESEVQVSAGAALVGSSGEAVAAIVADMAEINRIVQGIARAAQDQTNGLAEINAGVSMLDKVTQQNAAMVEETTAASTQLKNEADRLTSILSGFQLSETSSRTNTHRAA